MVNFFASEMDETGQLLEERLQIADISAFDISAIIYCVKTHFNNLG